MAAAEPPPPACRQVRERPRQPLPATLDEESIRDLIREKAGRTVRTHRGRHYTIFSDDPDRDLAGLDRSLDEAIESFGKILGATLPKDEASLPVIQFREEKDYRSFCEALDLEEHALEAYGCYVSHLSFRPVVMQGAYLGTMRHESAHQFVDRAMGNGLRSWAWVAEGLGALFEAYPARGFTIFRRYRTGRKRILDPTFSLEAFAMKKGRFDGIYDIGATIHGIFLFGEQKQRYRAWLHDLAQSKCKTKDLPRYLDRTWKDLEGEVRRFCRSHVPEEETDEHPGEKRQTER